MNKRGRLAFLKTRRFWAAFFLVAALLTASTIFFFSAQEQDASSGVSDPITKKVSKVAKSKKKRKKMTKSQRKAYMELVSKIVRKCAHFGEFALLSFNLAAWLRLRRRRLDARRAAIFASALGALYACSDEVHQLFVKGRSCSLLDIGIDSAGAIAGALVATLLLHLLARRHPGAGVA